MFNRVTVGLSGLVPTIVPYYSDQWPSNLLHNFVSKSFRITGCFSTLPFRKSKATG